MKKQILIAWILLLNINFVQACSTEGKRIALVIGNSNYGDTQVNLTNPENDVHELAKTLREKLGFYVFEEYDLTKKRMETVIQNFGNCLKQTKGIGLFYYSGHGMQFNGNNYLIAVDGSEALDSEPEIFLKQNIVSDEKMLKVMEDANNDANIIIIDACRDNPYKSKGKRMPYKNGLAESKAPSGSIIAYAAASGKVAYDGGDYAKHLITEISKPNVSITTVFDNVRTKIREATGEKQEPEYLARLNRKIYLNGVNPIEFTVKQCHRLKSILPPRQAIDILNISKDGNSINYWKFPWQKQWNLPNKKLYNDFIKSVGLSLNDKEFIDFAMKNFTKKGCF